MVNINIELPDELHKRAKVAATMKGVTLKQYLIDILAAAVPRQAPEVKRK